MIGLFLNDAAKMSYHHLLVRHALQGETVRRFMNPGPIVVPDSLGLRHWVEEFVYRCDRKTFPVVSNGHLAGYVQTKVLTQVSREEWDRRTVGEVMRHDLAALTIPPDADALDALGKMERSDVDCLLVTAGDRLVGTISVGDLLRFLNLKLKLEGVQGVGRDSDQARASIWRRELKVHEQALSSG